ncbi:hypothetical protein [Streptomyces sp. NPDC127084]|uniref:hypothetical protein n=1 Tax=Streptomyces sp. NPDC127084 TaxID=3347133 RepID=UPI00366A1820
MSGMEAEVLAGIIGAGAGTVAALLGGWLQQRHQTKLAREEREAARQDAAFDTAAAAVFAFQDLFRRRRRGGTEEDWEHQLHGQVDRLRLAALTLNETKLRERLEEAADLIVNWQLLVPNGLDEPHEIRAALQVADHVRDVLGQYRRTGKVPEPSKGYAEAKGWMEEWEELYEEQQRLRRLDNQR